MSLLGYQRSRPDSPYLHSMSLYSVPFFEQVVDAFRAHPAKAVVEQHVFGQRESCVDEHRVDRIVAGHVPASWIAAAATCVMLQRRVHDFMGQSSRNLGCAQGLHELRIEAQGNAIGRHGGDRAASLRAQAEQQRSEEGVIQQQRGPRLLDANHARECFVI